MFAGPRGFGNLGARREARGLVASDAGPCDDRAVLACPECSRRLAVQRQDGGIVYSCRNCLGRAATLRALRGQTTVAACDGLRAFARREGASPSVLSCPSCTRGMVLTDAKHVGVTELVDVCPRCDLVWSSKGDFGALPRRDRRAPADARPADPGTGLGSARAIVGQKSPGTFASFDVPSRLEDVPVWFGAPVEIKRARRTTRPYATWLILAGLVVGACVTLAFDADVYRSFLGWRRPLARVYALLFSWKPSDFALEHLVVRVHDPMRAGGWNLLIGFFANAHPLAAVAYGFWFWVFADDVEALLGRIGFVALVFGASAMALWTAANGSPPEVPIQYGATGGLAAVVACYAVMLPHVEIGFFGRRADPVARVAAWLAPLGLAFGLIVLRLIEAKEARLVPFVVGTVIGAAVGALMRRPKAARESA